MAFLFFSFMFISFLPRLHLASLLPPPPISGSFPILSPPFDFLHLFRQSRSEDNSLFHAQTYGMKSKCCKGPHTPLNSSPHLIAYCDIRGVDRCSSIHKRANLPL
ncbi:hypothetical protein S83_034274 [Arachis hypogaea]